MQVPSIYELLYTQLGYACNIHVPMFLAQTRVFLIGTP
jgi:hypothetical protein